MSARPEVERWPPAVPVECVFRQTEPRDGGEQLLQLTAAGIELGGDELIPWSAVLGAQVATDALLRRHVPSFSLPPTEKLSSRSLVVFGCLPTADVAPSASRLHRLAAYAGSWATYVLSGGKAPTGRGRSLVQWVFRYTGEDSLAVVDRLATAVQREAAPQSTTHSRRRFLAIVNPAGGSGIAERIYEQVVAPVLEQSSVDVELVVTQHGGHARELAASLKLQQYDVVVIVGGDGLISEVVQGLMSRADWADAIRQPLGIIPGGTGNGLSASLLSRVGESLDPLNAAFALVKGTPLALDLTAVANDRGDMLYSFLSVEWAFIAAMDIESERYRALGDVRFPVTTAKLLLGRLPQWSGTLRYLSSEQDSEVPQYVKASATAPRPDLDALPSTAQQWREIKGNFTMFWAMNVTHASTDAFIAPPACLDDGYMHIVVAAGPNASRWQLLQLMLGIDSGSHLAVNHVQLLRTRGYSLRIDNSSDLVAVDGEVFGGQEFKAEILRGLARVVGLPNN